MGTRDEREIRATMVRIKAKVENLMTQLETSLGIDPVPLFSLRRKFSKAEDLWADYEGLYDQLCAIQGEDLDEQDSNDFAAFTSVTLE